MTNKNTTPENQTQSIAPEKNAITLFIIDQSGSMESLKAATEESHTAVVNKIRQECLELPQLQQYTNTWVFGGSRIHEPLPLKKVIAVEAHPELVLNCSGSTPLFDAIGKACTDLEMRLNNLGFHNENTLVSVAVFTDGEENSSHQFSQAEVKRLITRLKTQGWIFNYYGTDTSVEEMKERLAFNDGMMMAKTASAFHGGMAQYSMKSKLDKLSWLNQEDF
jgi:hypothetical protein